METTAAQQAEAALVRLTTKTVASPPNIEAVDWDWQWKVIGNETAAETEKLREMLTAAQSFISEIIEGREPRWLTLIGNPGCGKTHLGDRIRWYLRDFGQRAYNANVRPVVDPQSQRYDSIYSYAQEGAVFCKWSNILSRARNGDYSLFGKACRDHYKVIDDLGVDSLDKDSQATSFATQKMGELLDRRVGKWTVITTNFSRADLAKKFDPRIASRLLRNESVIVDCEGLRDFNLRKLAL